MSYSFSVVAKTKAALKVAALKAVAAHVAPQQAHERDTLLVANTIAAVIDTLDEPPEGKQLAVACYGSTGGSRDGAGALLTVTNNDMSVKVSHIDEVKG